MDKLLPRRVRLWRKYNVAVALGLVAAISAAGLGVLAAQRSPDVVVALDRITTAVAMTSQIAETAAFVAKVGPKDLLQIASPEGGRIAEIYVTAGSMVRAGQKILRLENTEREVVIGSRVSQIRADINALRAQESQIGQARLIDRKAVLQAEYDLQKARTDLAHRQILADKGILGPAHLAPNRKEVAFYETLLQETEQTEQSNEKLRLGQLSSLAEQSSDLDQNLASARAQLADFMILAPRDGMIIGLTDKPGATVAAGSQVAELDPRLGLVLEAELDQYYASRVHEGMAATVMDRGDRHLRVTRVSPDVREGIFRVEFAFADAPPSDLKVGETIQGRLVLADGQQAVTVPNGPFMSASNGQYVFVVSGDGRQAERRIIRIGARTPEQIAVLDGLSDGDRIIVSNYESFADARRIEIR